MPAIASKGTYSARLSLILAGLMAFGMGVLAFSTRFGIGILPDSTRYMQLSPVPYDAPLYPWVLATGRLLGFENEAAAYGIAVALFIANTGLIFLILKTVCGPHRIVLVSAALLVVLSPQYIRAHMVAMSEPMFLFLAIVCALAFWRYLEEDSLGWLLASSVALGLCMLTRFSAAPLGAALATSLLLYARQRPWRDRLLHLILFCGVSGAIFLAWIAGSTLAVGRSVGRSLWFYGNADWARWVSGFETLSTFLLPSQIPALLRYALTFCLLLAFAWIAVLALLRVLRRQESPADRLLLMLALFVVWYAAFMVLAVSIEANLPLNARYMLPVYLALVVFFATWFGQRPVSEHAGAAQLLLLALVGLVIASDGLRLASQTREAYAEGIGYQAPRWFASPIIRAVGDLPADARIYSNAPDALNYLTDRDAQLVPTQFERRTGIENPDNPYAAQVAALRSALRHGDTYVVFIDHVDWRFYLASEKRLGRDADLRAIRTEEDGRIYTSNLHDGNVAGTTAH